MTLPMAGLALLTLVFGFFAGNFSSLLQKGIATLQNIATFDSSYVSGFRAVSVRDGFASVSMPALALILLTGFLLIFLVVSFVSGRQKTSRNITWDCGSDLSPRMEITATAFSHSIITVLKGVLRPSRQTEVEYHDAALRYFPKSRTVRFGIADVYALYLYGPFKNFITRASRETRKIQSGNINTYVLYIFILLLGLLFFLTI